jgi:hypothetical protein
MRRHIRQSQSKESFLPKITVDATAITHDPGDALAENGLPQHEPESEQVLRRMPKSAGQEDAPSYH